MIDFNVGIRTIKVIGKKNLLKSQDKKKDKPCDFRLGNGFLDIPKIYVTKEKQLNWLSKNKNV